MKVVGRIEKTGGEIRVILHEWKSQIYCDLRLWYLKDSEYHPTTKGLRFNAELLPEFIEALQEAENVIERGDEIGGTKEAEEHENIRE